MDRNISFINTIPLTGKSFIKELFMNKLKTAQLVCILLSLLFVVMASDINAAVSSVAGTDRNSAIAKTSGLLIPFIENRGQTDSDAKYYANTFAGTVYVTGKGDIVYSLLKPENTNEKSLSAELSVIRESVVGANEITAKGENKSITKINYFVGSERNWESNVPSYEGINLGNVYKGIQLKLKAYGRNVEKLFIVEGSGEVSDIRLRMEGVRNLHVNSSGELEIYTDIGMLKFTKPVAYQVIGGEKKEVPVSYEVCSNGEHGSPGLTYGFNISSYDKNYPLVIDPLLASTFLGGLYSDYGMGISLDAEGNVFVTGYTSSSNFPTASESFDSAYDTTYNNSSNSDYYYDAFVSKLSSNLDNLIASTFLGGSSNDYASSIALDSSGNVFVTGYTSSSNFPVASDSYGTGYDNSHNGSEDIFVSKLSNDLSSLKASTFLGGSSNDRGNSIALDSIGNAYVTGYTNSSNFPTASDSYGTAYDTTRNGSIDVFVSKFTNDLSTLMASTFLGGGGSDYGNSIAVDSGGNVYVTGYTYGYSSSNNYPVTPGAYDTSHNGYYDVFVSKLNSGLNEMLASTFIGGSDYDTGNSLAIDPLGNVFVTGYSYGYTSSSSSSYYPTTPGAYDTSVNGDYDVFISKFSNNLDLLLASTLAGGNDDDYAYSIALDSEGNVIVAGYTYYSSNYPTTTYAYDTSYNGNADVIVSKLDNNLSFLLASTFLGSSNGDYANAVVLDSAGNVYVTGSTWSSNFPTTFDAHDTTYNSSGSSSRDVFIAKLDSNMSDKPGTINVSTNIDSATFSVDGPSSGSGSGTSWSMSDAAPGTYKITYGEVDGYIAPFSEEKLLTSSGAINFTGQYVAKTGSIIVTTNISSAIFTINGTTIYSGSGTYWSTFDAESGEYTITYGDVDGYITPNSETKTLVYGSEIVFTGAYTPTAGSIVVMTNLESSTFELDGPAVYSGSGTLWNREDTIPGSYTIKFGEVEGYTSPAEETKVLDPEGYVIFIGLYTPVPGIINVSTNISAATYTIEGPELYSGTGKSWSKDDAYPGAYVITYKNVPGYKTPASETKLLSNGGAVVFKGHYVKLLSADLTAKGVKSRKSVNRGGQFKLKAFVTNSGKAEADSFKVSFYLSSNKNLSIDNDSLIGTKKLNSLKKGKSRKTVLNWHVPSGLSSGKYYIKVVWDYNNYVDESDEDNNIEISSRIEVK